MQLRSIHLRAKWLTPPIIVIVGIAAVTVLELRRERLNVTRATKQEEIEASLVRLLRTQEIRPEVFTCPATQPTNWDFGGGANTALNWSNWNATPTEVRALGYQYQNPYAPSSTRPSDARRAQPEVRIAK